ncbi:HTH-type transcriptional regulator CymR [Methylacidimicrobium cyclopophantes]|uniref:HTH-type transcriptional regulator CymR n=1 Tax=Methylacidimicrobium cyclopophantes TaxID=1041766 RepID=A0A5E6MB23_9BACT|nr:Rrf2 family transcriptional regulator [Methylacidimicrobium cyclopophantes]VVM05519.1 HTH-type transcriptional regulator CymR [Methylacidimicrobium cyclopophantes]
MVLTRRSKYALRALIYLARVRGTGAVLIGEIAEKERIPKKFLEAILLELKNKGILESRRGKGGGYQLAESADKVMVGQIIRLMDGPIAPVRCVSPTAYAPCDDCPNEETCTIRVIMREIRAKICEVVDRTSLSDLVEREEQLRLAANRALSFDI